MALETGSFFVVIHERPWRSLCRKKAKKRNPIFKSCGVGLFSKQSINVIIFAVSQLNFVLNDTNT
jgi:hypothetical protein